MTCLGLLRRGLVLSKNRKAPRVPMPRKCSAIVLAIVLLPDPASPRSHRIFRGGDGVIIHSVTDSSILCWVPAKQDLRSNASIGIGRNIFSLSDITACRVSETFSLGQLRTKFVHLPPDMDIKDEVLKRKLVIDGLFEDLQAL